MVPPPPCPTVCSRRAGALVSELKHLASVERELKAAPAAVRPGATYNRSSERSSGTHPADAADAQQHLASAPAHTRAAAAR